MDNFFAVCFTLFFRTCNYMLWITFDMFKSHRSRLLETIYGWYPPRFFFWETPGVPRVIPLSIREEIDLQESNGLSAVETTGGRWSEKRSQHTAQKRDNQGLSSPLPTSVLPDAVANSQGRCSESIEHTHTFLSNQMERMTSSTKELNTLLMHRGAAVAVSGHQTCSDNAG
jgi:hypothetical protein